MTVKSYLTHALVKPAVAGVVAAGADHFVLKNTNLKSNAIFGATVAGGIASVSWVEPLVSPYFPTHTPLGEIGKSLEGRIVEITMGTAAAYAYNHFVARNNWTPNDWLMRVCVIAGADVVGETVCVAINLFPIKH